MHITKSSQFYLYIHISLFSSWLMLISDANLDDETAWDLGQIVVTSLFTFIHSLSSYFFSSKLVSGSKWMTEREYTTSRKHRWLHSYPCNLAWYYEDMIIVYLCLICWNIDKYKRKTCLNDSSYSLVNIPSCSSVKTTQSVNIFVHLFAKRGNYFGYFRSCWNWELNQYWALSKHKWF